MAIQFLNNVNADNGVLYVDAINNSVGIGTTSPAAKLHVNSGSTNQVARFQSTDGTAYLSIKDSNTTYSLQGIGSVGDELTFYNNNSEKVRIDSSGNVGIGTTSPGSRRLNVVTSSSGTDVGIESKILRTSGTNYSFLGFASGSGAAQNIGGFFSATGATTNTALWAYDGKVLLATQSTTDYVGIGTTSPVSALDISKDTASLLNLHRPNSSAAAASFLDFSFNTANGTEAVYSRIRSDVDTNTDSAQSGDLSFYNASSGSIVERMRITSAGNVGIGTNNPTRPLYVKNASAQTVAVFDGGNNSAGEIGFKGSGTTGETYVTIGAVGNDMSLSAGAAEKV